MSRLFVYILLFASSVASAQVKFIFDRPVDVFQPSGDGLGTATPAALGSEVKFDKDKVYWVQAKGRVPMLILPQETERLTAPLKVQMPEVAAWPPALVQHQVDLKVSQYVDLILRFQQAIRAKNVDEAQRTFNQMQSVARVDYLDFFRASLDFVRGDLKAAKASVLRGLERNPASEEGKSFLKALEEKGQ